MLAASTPSIGLATYMMQIQASKKQWILVASYVANYIMV